MENWTQHVIMQNGGHNSVSYHSIVSTFDMVMTITVCDILLSLTGIEMLTDYEVVIK